MLNETVQKGGWYLVGREGEMMLGPLHASEVTMTYDHHLDPSDFLTDTLAAYPFTPYAPTVGWAVEGTFKKMYISGDEFYALLGRKPHWTERLCKTLERAMGRCLMSLHALLSCVRPI